MALLLLLQLFLFSFLSPFSSKFLNHRHTDAKYYQTHQSSKGTVMKLSLFDTAKQAAQLTRTIHRQEIL